MRSLQTDRRMDVNRYMPLFSASALFVVGCLI